MCGEADYYTRGEAGHIADIIVAPEARGRGVGETLLAAAEQWARGRGYSLLTLNVFIENTRARALYERAGFGAEIGRVRQSVAVITGSHNRGGAGLIGGRHERTPFTFVFRLKTLSPLVTYISSKFGAAELHVRQRRRAAAPG